MSNAIPKMKLEKSGNSGNDHVPGKEGKDGAGIKKSNVKAEPTFQRRFNGPTDGTIKVGAFEDKGREIFGDDNYKMLRPERLFVFRLQYALRLEGLEIGKHGIGGWGGDGQIGKDTRSAIRFVMKREGFNYDQAVAWVMDRAKNKLGLGSDKPYFNPETKAFDLERPAWVKSPSVRSRVDELKWADATIYEFENERKFGPRREKLEKVWATQIEPVLAKNGRSEDFIEKSKQQFFQFGAKFIRSGSMDQAQAVSAYTQKNLKREENFAWVKAQWTQEILVHLKSKDVAPTVIAAIKRDFFGEYARDYIYARNAQEEALGKESFLREKNWILSWNPQGKNRVA